MTSESARPSSSTEIEPEDGGESESQHLAAARGAQGGGRRIRILGVPCDGRRGLLEQQLEGARSKFLVVLEPGRRLGDPLEQDAHVARARQHRGEPPRRAGRVAQHPQEPVRLAEVVGQAAEGQQAVVGIGALREPLQHDRQQVALDGGPPGDPAGEGGDVPQGARRVGEADRRESGLRLLAGERGAVGKRRHRREQRAVEQALVQGAHGVLGAPPQLDEVGCGGREPGRAREHAERVVVARHEVGAAQPGELQSVLEQTQEAVVLRELRRLLAPDVAPVGESGQGAERRTLTHRVVGLTVDELKQLDGELDVAQAARPELELNVDLAGRDVRGDPLAHPLDRFDEALARRARPHPRADLGHEALPQLEVAGERAGLEQRLELPVLRPAVVVGEVRVEGAHQRAGFALGAQVRVHLPERRLDRELVDAADGVHREPGADLDGPVVGETVPALGDEEHVDVAQVVELARPGLPHSDDRRGGSRRPRPPGIGSRSPSQLEGGVEGCGREVGEGRRHEVDGGERRPTGRDPTRRAW